MKNTKKMNVGIIGSGNIGSALARHLTALGHQVSIANSRGPASLAALAAETGATAATAEQAARAQDAVIIAVPEAAVQQLPHDILSSTSAVVVDTGNYYPSRDGQIAEIDSGLSDSEWVARMLGRRVVKAFNNIVADSLATRGVPAGTPGRICLSVAGDDPHAKELVVGLIEAIGFDGIDAGPLAESWRQQPGTPAYCRDLDVEGLKAALAQADIEQIAAYRAQADEAARPYFAHDLRQGRTGGKQTVPMKIGILGIGHIGKTLARKLAEAGHHVKVANSRGPETIEPDVLAFGAHTVLTAEAVKDVDVVILSIPLNRLPSVAPLIDSLPSETVVIDTSNYYPHRDVGIGAIEAGQVESLWMAEQLGRPIVKAWNAIGSDSLAKKGKPAGNPDRIAIPVAADRETDRRVGMMLVEDTGFDAFDAGTLEESWRQQPGAPAYCTDLTIEEMPAALAIAEKARLPKRRDLAVAAIQERVGDSKTNPDAEYGVRLNRALYM